MSKKLYQAQIIDEDTGDTLSSIFSYSQEGLEEEMGKSKWRGIAEASEEQIVRSQNPDEPADDKTEGLKPDDDIFDAKVVEAESKE